jgi:hypothetical protein
MSGDEASNAFQWAFLDITYNFTISIDINGLITVKGAHDGFPGYEVMVDSPTGNKEGFGFNQGKTPNIYPPYGDQGNEK